MKKLLPLLGGLFLLAVMCPARSWAWITNPAQFNSGVPNNIFSASTMTAVSSMGASSSTQSVTGLMLTNPIGSGKVLQLLRIKIAVSNITTSSATFTLMGNYVAETTATVHSSTISVVNANLGDTTSSVAIADGAGIVGNLSIIKYVGTVGDVSVIDAPSIDDIVEGNISLNPGSSIVLQTTSTPCTAGMTFVWQELNR